MPTDNNRLLLEIDKIIRELNRNEINAAIPEIQAADLNPVLSLVARTRASYLKTLFEVAEQVEQGMPSPDQVERLGRLRTTYEELVGGAQALETAIQRGYLDVLPQ